MSDLKQRVAQVIREEIAPALAVEGGDIELLDVADGVAQVRFHGACSSCSVPALIMALEQELRARFPEVQFLEAVP